MVIFDINLFKRSLTASVAVGFVAVCLSGCHSAAYKKRADRETNRILGKKVQGVDNVEWADVDITLPEPATLEGLGMNPENAEYLGKEAELESSAKMIPLDEALHLAIQPRLFDAEGGHFSPSAQFNADETRVRSYFCC